MATEVCQLDRSCPIYASVCRVNPGSAEEPEPPAGFEAYLAYITQCMHARIAAGKMLPLP